VTRWGILADIHGNLPALLRALSALRERGVERIAVLGDNLGRGDSDACVALIRKAADVSVLGNRDLDWQDRVTPASAAYVLGLPRLAQIDGIAFSHGDASLTRDLATGDIRAGFRRARRWLAAHTCRVWVFGHSHHARVWTVTDEVAAPVHHHDAARDGLPARVDLSATVSVPGNLTIINAGSVGLPFGGKGPASATLYDSAAHTVEVFAV
jgi:predicted phosphodiesterase